MDNPILALIASFIAMSFVASSYFVKNKSLYLIFQAFGILFLIVSYFFTVQFFAMIGLAIGLARALIFFVYEKNDKVAPLWVAFAISFLTIASYFIVDFWFLNNVQPYDALCLSALVLYAFIFRIRDLKAVRFMMLAPTVLSILYNTLTQAALFASLTYVFELTANVVSIFRYHILENGNVAQNLTKNVKEKYE